MQAQPLSFVADPLSPSLFRGDLGQGAEAFLGVLDDRALAALVKLAPSAHDLADAARHADPARFLQRRAITRSLLARRLGWAASSVVICHDGRGAPRVLARPGQSGALGTFVSVSARQNLFALAFAQHGIGIDLEPLNPTFDLPWNVLSAREQAALKALAPPARHGAFLELWTLREAQLKAQGTGFVADEGRQVTPRRTWLAKQSLQCGEVVVACVQVMR